MESNGPESPVIVSSSPVSSPVYINSRDDDDNSYNVTRNQNFNNSKNIELLELLETKTLPVISLALPALDESLIKVQIENIPIEDTKLSAATDNGAGIHNAPAASVDTKVVEKSAAEFVKDFKYCQEEFQKQIKADNCAVSPETIMKLLRIAMTIVEQTKETGANKKIFVVKLLNDIFINDATGILGEHKVEALNLISGNVVSDVIDFVVDASKGKLNVNKIEAVVENVAKSCSFQCWSRIFKRT
jgi:hypothetical protein